MRVEDYTSLVMHEEEDDLYGADQIWAPEQDHDNNLLDGSIFYNAGAAGDFPPLPDFPTMSSSSSSTSSVAAVKPPPPPSSAAVAAMSTSSSASSESSHTNNNNNSNNTANYCYYENQMVDTPSCGAGALSSTASMEISEPPPLPPGLDSIDCCMDGMDDFGCMDLLMDPIFGDGFQQFQSQDGVVPVQQQQQAAVTAAQEEEDLGEVFLEWLKNNKESVSAEDLRRIKIKKSTIDSAAKRLGGGKEAMKQLLKLILEWVQMNHLHRRRRNKNENLTAEGDVAVDNVDPAPPPLPAGYDNYQLDPVQINVNPWGAAAASEPVVGYPYGMGSDPFGNNVVGPNFNANYGVQSTDYNFTSQVIESAQSWPSSRFPMAAPSPVPYGGFDGMTQPGGFSGYLNQNQYPYPYLSAEQSGGGGVGVGGGDTNRLVRLGSSATKEARKKRMARQRRFIPHHHRNHHTTTDSQVGLVQQHQQGNLVYWPPLPPQAAAAGSVPMDGAPVMQTADRPAVQNQNHQKQGGASDKRKGWKAEKNLRFLLQKVLKQSDVGSLGRIVLPKKEAETHLPELDARDGISIAMEDIGTSRVWNMRYRFWPNNKSRMYLLENTGDFVRANGLQEGDFIVIYSDVKCGKYLIRGVKVRQPAAGLSKPESKKAAGGANGSKSQRKPPANSSSAANNNKTTSPPVQQLAQSQDTYR
ncbi:Regulatory protein viviparous-1 [Linum grandiflorum]